MKSNSIQWYLEQWGLWQRVEANGAKGYPSPVYALLAQNIAQPSPLGIVATQDDCMRLDTHIAKLKVRNSTQYQVVFLYYVKSLSVEAIAQALRLKATAVRLMRLQAESWLDGAVFA